MKVTLAGMELVNPVIAASGTFGYGIEFEEIVSLERHRRIRHQGHLARSPWPAIPPRALSRPLPACSTPSACRMSASRSTSSASCPPMRRYPALQGHRQRLRLHGRRIHSGHRAPQPGRGHRGLRAERLLPQRSRRRHGLRLRSRLELEYLVGRAREARRPSAHRQALAQRHLHRPHGQDRRRKPAPTPSA